MPDSISLTLGPNDRLEPCPFCGGNSIELQNTWTPSYWLECQDCEARASSRGHWNEQEDPQGTDPESHELAKAAAIAAWNRRPSDRKPWRNANGTPHRPTTTLDLPWATQQRIIDVLRFLERKKYHLHLGVKRLAEDSELSSFVLGVVEDGIARIDLLSQQITNSLGEFQEEILRKEWDEHHSTPTAIAPPDEPGGP